MQYKYCSIKPVIWDIIRNTRLQDSSYISDAHDWVYEAMELMETRQALKGYWTELNIQYHKAKLPCELQYIEAVEWCHKRLREGGGVRPAEKDCPIYKDEGAFLSTVEQEPTPDGYAIYVGKITLVKNLSFDPVEYYYTELGYINTSFPEGTVTVYYRGIAMDKDGLPLIPDNRNYKLALYWYCRAMMIGSGYEDKQFTFNDCWEMFDKVYAPRAIGEITYPSPEQMEHRVNTLTRLLPYDGYYDSFFHTDRPEPNYHFGRM